MQITYCWGAGISVEPWVQHLSAYLGSGALYGLKVLTLLILDRQEYFPCASLPAPFSLLVTFVPFSPVHPCFHGLQRRWGALPLALIPHGISLKDCISPSRSSRE